MYMTVCFDVNNKVILIIIIVIIQKRMHSYGDQKKKRSVCIYSEKKTQMISMF